MKRILEACLEQTIKFEPKEDYEKYKKDLERKSTKYTIIEEIENHESITVKLKKQYNDYPCGNYMN